MITELLLASAASSALTWFAISGYSGLREKLAGFVRLHSNLIIEGDLIVGSPLSDKEIDTVKSIVVKKGKKKKR
jgi:hypothetical protein